MCQRVLSTCQRVPVSSSEATPILSLRSEPRVLTNALSQLLIDRIDNRTQWLPGRHDTARPGNIWQLEIFLFVPRRQKEINIGILWAGARDAIMHTIITRDIVPEHIVMLKLRKVHSIILDANQEGPPLAGLGVLSVWMAIAVHFQDKGRKGLKQDRPC